ncbi:MAG: hypothetical protein ACYC9O_15375, partial [Candidatus Latescibacterota bacterium]
YFLITTFLMCCLLAAGCITSSSEKEKPAVEVNATALDFGETVTTMTFMVTLADENTEWKIEQSEIPSWCRVDIEQMTAGSRVVVNVNRSMLPPGEHTYPITVTWNSGSRTITVRAVVPYPGTIIIDTPIPEQEEIIP